MLSEPDKGLQCKNWTQTHVRRKVDEEVGFEVVL